MSELEELYQEIIMEHYRKPRNFRKVEGATGTVEGYNPFCGDRITLYVKVVGDKIADVGFQGSGCAISKASASMMTESIKGKSEAEAQEIFDAFHQMLTGGPEAEFDASKLGDLELLEGVSQFPIRVKCATLGWHTLHAALEGKEQTITTE